MVTIDNLRVTPYHPIIHYKAFQQSWIFPINIKKPTVVECRSMYTFVIENRNALIVDGFIFATYGHGLEGNVISHDYFGSNKVINDLKKMDTYEDGYVLLDFSWRLKLNDFSASINVNNVLNTSYRNYLNSMRYFADEIGRNFIVNFSYTFKKKN